MAWVYLVLAGFLEVGWAIGLRFSEGFTKPWPSLLTLVALAGSMFLLSMAVKTIPLGTGYAIWTGIGAVGTAIAGVVLFAEPASAARLACLGLIVAGMIGLKLTSG